MALANGGAGLCRIAHTRNRSFGNSQSKPPRWQQAGEVRDETNRREIYRQRCDRPTARRSRGAFKET